MDNVFDQPEACPSCGCADSVRPKLVLIDEAWHQEPGKDPRERYLVDLRVDDIASDEVRTPPLEQFVEGLYCEKCNRAFVPDSKIGKWNHLPYHGSDGRKTIAPTLKKSMDTPIITREMLRIYEKFHGDIDGFARGGKLGERLSITEKDWHFIDEILQSLVIVQAGRANPEFEASVRARLLGAAQDEQVFERLYELAKPKI
jgi:hypothetical protein